MSTHGRHVPGRLSALLAVAIGAAFALAAPAAQADLIDLARVQHVDAHPTLRAVGRCWPHTSSRQAETSSTRPGR